jgi:DNA invertase Pin-like site-specific DNA recombinase
LANIGYARVSKRLQNLDLQLDALERAGCESIYQEKMSGARDDRPQLAEALRTARAGDCIVVWRLDRLARSLQHLVQIVDDLQQRDIRFKSLTESIDTSGATGRLVFHVLAALAEFERELMIERVTAGLEAARARGYVGGPPPYGIGPDQVSIVESEARLLVEAAERILDREPVSRVVDDWNQRGIRTRRGGLWRTTPLREQLRNPRVSPILGADVHSQLVQLFGAPDRQQQGRPARHLLSGILRCATCTQPLYGGHVHGDKWVYRCRKARGSGGRFHGCGAVSISMSRTDQAVYDLFADAACGPVLGRHLTTQLEALHQGGPTPDELAREAEELVELEAVLGTRFATAEHRARAAELEQRAAAAEARMLGVPDLVALANLPRTHDELRADWDGWTSAERRTWLRRMFNHIAVKPAPPGTHHRGSDVGARLDPDWRI